MEQYRGSVVRENGTFGFVAFLTFVGALFYFLRAPDGFWGVVLGVLEAMVWPAIAVYHGLDLLGA